MVKEMAWRFGGRRDGEICSIGTDIIRDIQ